MVALYFQYEFDISQDVRNNELNYPAYGSKADDIIAFETASRLVTVRLIKKFRDLIDGARQEVQSELAGGTYRRD